MPRAISRASTAATSPARHTPATPAPKAKAARAGGGWASGALTRSLDRDLLKRFSTEPVFAAFKKMGASNGQVIDAVLGAHRFRKNVNTDLLQQPDVLRSTNASVTRALKGLQTATPTTRAAALTTSGLQLEKASGHLFTAGADAASPELLAALGDELQTTKLATAHVESALKLLAARPAGSTRSPDVLLNTPHLFGALEMLTRTDPAEAQRLGTKVFAELNRLAGR